MAQLAKANPEPRWRRRFHARETLAEDLGGLGAWVGPRTGPFKRTQGQKEDYVFRRLLVAWKQADRLRFPFTVTAPPDDRSHPDVVVDSSDDDFFGVEVTEAGTEVYQAWLTRFERDGNVQSFESQKGPSEVFVNDVTAAIEKKIRRLRDGRNLAVPRCELAVYLNTAWDGLLDRDPLIPEIRNKVADRQAFSAVHLVSDEIVWLDALSEHCARVSIRGTFEADYAGWLFDQVEKLRLGQTEDIDWNNLVGEIEDLGKSEQRALRSYLERLLLHLLKWRYQPEKRSSSWQNSIDDSREEISERLMESPYLRSYARDVYTQVYGKARRHAASETGLARQNFPGTPPFTLEEALDPEFLPDNHERDEE